MIEGYKKPSIKNVWLRLILFFFAGLLVPTLFGVGLEKLGLILFDEESVFLKLFFAFGQFIGIMFTLLLFLREIEFESVNFIGIGKTSIVVNFKAFLGTFALITIFFLILIFFNQIKVVSIFFDYSNFTFTFLFLLFLAAYEELFFRAYILPVLCKKVNYKIGILVNSIVFTSLHLLNFNISFIGILNIFILGLYLAYIFHYTKNILLIIVIHLTWNLSQAFFGFNISGNMLELDFFLTIGYIGESYISGGKFGLEGSILVTVILTICFGIFILYSKYFSTYEKYRKKINFLLYLGLVFIFFIVFSKWEDIERFLFY
ncbi:MAG: CPBP family intramembrane metalloprotease [Draconibacterium sp.]|nr:CPBP family intramembrane metalloprotease [Draconibacterium sp.]